MQQSYSSSSRGLLGSERSCQLRTPSPGSFLHPWQLDPAKVCTYTIESCFFVPHDEKGHSEIDPFFEGGFLEEKGGLRNRPFFKGRFF
jgi:hypothetical protein